ncbi:glycosyltransferase family 1 protein [Fortiea contorta]|uniref:glycosyltransferase family 1 protein n=1 Tax=Fortiea contorta TaxID=1892405 RepID=UPI00034D79AF|nr:glycosyltransferase family 1 protein [Fortiea contorta]
MSPKNHILYIGGVIPKQSFSGSAILYRHLQRLEDSNWKISVVSSEQKALNTNFPESWRIIALPDRRLWWPPVREKIPGSLELRLHLWKRECNKLFSEDRPSAILTVLWDYYSLLAAAISKSWNIPLSVIVHDDWELFSPVPNRSLIRKYKQNILEQSTRIWPVSARLGETIKLSNPRKQSVLLPIGSERNQNFIDWSDNFKQPVVAYAGTIYPKFSVTLKRIAKTLEKIKGTLILITSSQNDEPLESLKECPNIQFQEPLATNDQALDFLAKNASCILVGYPFEQDKEFPWLNSFPSKLIEFANLGMPMLILTPSNTALSDWAVKHDWLCYLNEMDETKLLEVLLQISRKQTWEKMSEQTRFVSRNEFNPNLIHRQFESEIAMIK